MSTRGVVRTLDLPPSTISDSLQRHVDAILGRLGPNDGHMAELTVTTKTGINFVYAYNDGAGKFQAGVWVGKSGWDATFDDVDAGVFISKRWKVTP